jgi:hypothetical protein
MALRRDSDLRLIRVAYSSNDCIQGGLGRKRKSFYMRVSKTWQVLPAFV